MVVTTGVIRLKDPVTLLEKKTAVFSACLHTVRTLTNKDKRVVMEETSSTWSTMGIPHGSIFL